MGVDNNGQKTLCHGVKILESFEHNGDKFSPGEWYINDPTWFKDVDHLTIECVEEIQMVDVELVMDAFRIDYEHTPESSVYMLILQLGMSSIDDSYDQKWRMIYSHECINPVSVCNEEFIRQLEPGDQQTFKAVHEWYPKQFNNVITSEI
jgi:hypothetical protein